MAYSGSHARSTKDEARPASDDVPQSMSLRTFHRLYAEILQILVPRIQRPRFYPQAQYASNGRGWGGEGYPMQAYPPPGKTYKSLVRRNDADGIAYNTDHVPPPVYQPPDGGSKINPHQDWAAVPPPGPPPGHEAGESSRMMETVPLNQDGAGQEHTTAQSYVQTENPGMMSRLNPFK